MEVRKNEASWAEVTKSEIELEIKSIEIARTIKQRSIKTIIKKRPTKIASPKTKVRTHTIKTCINISCPARSCSSSPEIKVINIIKITSGNKRKRKESSIEIKRNRENEIRSSK